MIQLSPAEWALVLAGVSLLGLGGTWVGQLVLWLRARQQRSREGELVIEASRQVAAPSKVDHHLAFLERRLVQLEGLRGQLSGEQKALLATLNHSMHRRLDRLREAGLTLDFDELSVSAVRALRAQIKANG